MTIQGKYALITGSSRGIGRGIALKLAEKGVKIAVNYYQNEAAAKDTLAKVRDRGSDGFLVQADFSARKRFSEVPQRARPCSTIGRQGGLVVQSYGRQAKRRPSA